MGRDTPSRILDDERRAFAAQSMARWNDAALLKAAWDIPTKLLEVGVGIWFDTDGSLNLDKLHQRFSNGFDVGGFGESQGGRSVNMEFGVAYSTPNAL